MTQPPANGMNETSQPPISTEDTTQPPTDNSTQPPTDGTTQPPTVDVTQPPTDNTTQAPTQPTTNTTTQAPAQGTTQPTTEGPTLVELGSGAYCEIFLERETERLRILASREGKNFTTKQLRDALPEECLYLLENIEEVTQPTAQTTPQTTNDTSQTPTNVTQPPTHQPLDPPTNNSEHTTERPTQEEFGSGEYCQIFLDREKERLQTLAHREGRNFTIDEVLDTLPEECHFLVEDEQAVEPSMDPSQEEPTTGRKRRAQKWNAKSFWRDVSKKVRARNQAVVSPASGVHFEVERSQWVKDELDDAVFKDWLA